MIYFKYKPDDLRYLFLYSEDRKETELLEDYLNKIPQYMFLPSFSGVPKPEVFLDKFKSKQGRLIHWCHAGLYKTIIDFLDKHGIQYENLDNNFKYTGFNTSYNDFEDYIKKWNLSLQPYDYQIKAAWVILHYRQSLSQLATRAGKTLIAYIIFRWMLEHGAKNILMIVPSIQLVKQGVEDMAQYAEFFKTETVWAKSELCSSSNLTIGTFQSLVQRASRKSKKYDPKFFNKFDVVLVDEAHHLPCKSINTILNLPFLKHNKIKFGFTGTLPQEHTIESFACHSLMGPTIQDLSPMELVEDGFLAKPNIIQIRIDHKNEPDLIKEYIKCGEYLNSNYVEKDKKKILLPEEEQDFTIKHVKKLPTTLEKLKSIYDENEYMMYLVDLCKSKGSNLLMLEQMLVHRSTKRLEIMCNILNDIDKNTIVFAHHDGYLTFLKKEFQNRFPDRPIYLIKGSTTLKNRTKIVENMLKDKNAILCASYGCCSTGITFKNVDYGIFAQSFKSEIIVKQSIGRLMLKNSEKDEFFLYDLVDIYPTKRLEEQGKQKEKLYKKENFQYMIKNM